MKECSRRFVLWLLALAVSGILFLQGRPIAATEETIAFLPEASAGLDGVTIRIKGDCVTSGVYQYNNAISIGTVINMTVPFLRNIPLDPGLFKKKLYTGDVVLFSHNNGQHSEIKRESMPVVEKMVLAIPLDPNRLTAVEWEMLPRIGPCLAKRIVADRQYNGDYLSIGALERVPGIGPATVKQLEGYFDHTLVP